MIEIDKLKQIKKLDEQEIVEYRNSLYMHVDPTMGSDIRELWGAWHRFFFLDEGKTLEKINEYYDTFWEWFVILTWSSKGMWTMEQMEFVLPYQLSTIPQVVPQSLDKIIIMYMDRFNSEQVRSSFHNKVKEKLNSIDYNLTGNVDTTMEISEVRKTVENILVGVEKNTLTIADFYSKVQKSLFIEGKGYKFPEDTHNQITYDFVDLIKIFSSKADINKLVIEYFRIMMDVHTPRVDVDFLSKLIAENYKNDLKKTLDEAGMIIEDKVEDADMNESGIDYDKIINEIEAEFTFDTDGHATDLSAILTRLDELSKKHNDPAIAELYYYDESSGKFRWHTN